MHAASEVDHVQEVVREAFEVGDADEADRLGKVL